MMPRDYPRLRLRGIPDIRLLRPGGEPRPRRRLLAREVFRLAFYLPHDHADIALGVSQAIDRYVRAVGEGPKTLHHVSLSHDEGGPLTVERWAWVRRLLLETRRWTFPDDYEGWERAAIEKRRFERGLLFTGGVGIQNGYALEYKARIPWRPEAPFTSLLTATLPLDYLEAHGPGPVRQLALDMAAPLRFASGHAGLALRIQGPLAPRDAAFRFEALRHPGIDLREAWGQEEWMGERIDGVHWLNFIGPPVLSRLGGMKALSARLHLAQGSVEALDAERIVISLGPQPDAGTSLPSYRELAGILEPWLEPPPARPPPLHFTADEARHWWRRFLD
ncbi:type VI immunity family protein [Melittangium boletus]|uniref:type VI immunity family protein n=1 Tax=Melittangium boletus TaxID=83453 RepID=UPI003DA5932E